MNLLGKSCICPGFSTVICNLMISKSATHGTQFEPWLQEYVSGCGQEIYCTNISPHLAGKTFSQVVLLLYRECNCLLFAIEIVDKQGFARVVLNPASYVIPRTRAKVFVIAQDVDDADQVCDYGQHVQQEERRTETAEDADAEERVGESGSEGWWADQGEYQYPPEASGMAKARDLQVRLCRACHVRSPSCPLHEAVHESVEFLEGHVLVCGSPSSMAVLVHTLRPRHIPRKKILPIVFLHPALPARMSPNSASLASCSCHVGTCLVGASLMFGVSEREQNLCGRRFRYIPRSIWCWAGIPHALPLPHHCRAPLAARSYIDMHAKGDRDWAGACHLQSLARAT